MINQKDVVRMLVPFPDISSQLALDTHMYICINNGAEKKFIKCQKFKPAHKITSNRPYNYIIEDSDLSRNPFNIKTTIDCDKSFSVNNVRIDLKLLTTNRKDVCDDLFNNINKKTDHATFSTESIDPDQLCSINRLIKKTTMEPLT